MLIDQRISQINAPTQSSLIIGLIIATPIKKAEVAERMLIGQLNRRAIRV
jgi:hypothetical protein